MNKNVFTGFFAALLAAAPVRGAMAPSARIHMPIGVPNTVDMVKTMVEPEGYFSPGFGSYGVYFWLSDPATGKLATPEFAQTRYGLRPPGFLVPWMRWSAQGVEVFEELGQVGDTGRGDAIKGPPAQTVGVTLKLRNLEETERRFRLIACIRPLGPAGDKVGRMQVSLSGTAGGAGQAPPAGAAGSVPPPPGRAVLLADGHTALLALKAAAAAGAGRDDTLMTALAAGRAPLQAEYASSAGDAAGYLAFDFRLAPKDSASIGFIAPVHPGRWVTGHAWTPARDDYTEAAPLNPAPGQGFRMADKGEAGYAALDPFALVEAAAAENARLFGAASLVLPDKRWSECFFAVASHLAQNLNEDEADVAVVNYNVFNRDVMYIANSLQKLGQFPLSERICRFMLRRPFSGRPFPESDNPGQILWTLAEHWKFTRDRAWLARFYPEALRVGALIEYYRTTPAPWFIAMDTLLYDAAVPAEKRVEFKLGRVDGGNGNYSDAFDVGGLRALAELAEAQGDAANRDRFSALAQKQFLAFDASHGKDLSRGYGSYSAVWPARLYPLDHEKVKRDFVAEGPQPMHTWRYFGLAAAHQGLLAGNRDAAYKTLETHLAFDQMKNWYVMDEGPFSARGMWTQALTNWKADRAMPHGWAIAEAQLLLRDCLLFEDGNGSVLLGGIPPAWFTGPSAFGAKNLPTHFGPFTFDYRPTGKKAHLLLSEGGQGPGGMRLRLPAALNAAVTVDGKAITPDAAGDFPLPKGTREAVIISEAIHGTSAVGRERLSEGPAPDFNFSIRRSSSHVEIGPPGGGGSWAGLSEVRLQGPNGRRVGYARVGGGVEPVLRLPLPSSAASGLLYLVLEGRGFSRVKVLPPLP